MNGEDSWVLWGFLCLLVVLICCACSRLCYLNALLCFCSVHMWPLSPRGRFGGHFIIWLWCYNTVGLQWCCSSSLTLLAPSYRTSTTNPYCCCCCRCSVSWAPPPPCSHQAMCGWPMRRWRPWQLLPKRSVPVSPFSLCLCVGVDEERSGWCHAAVKPSLSTSCQY